MPVEICGYTVYICDQHTIQVYSGNNCLAQVCGKSIMIEDESIFNKDDLIILLAKIPIQIHMEAGV